MSRLNEHGKMMRRMVRLGFKRDMTDAEIGVVLGVTRARVQQIRVELGLSKPTCACGRTFSGTRGHTHCVYCRRLEQEPKTAPCARGCGRLTYIAKGPVCSRCRNSVTELKSEKRRQQERLYNRLSYLKRKAAKAAASTGETANATE